MKGISVPGSEETSKAGRGAGRAASSEADGAPQTGHGRCGRADGRPGTRSGEHRVRTPDTVRDQQVRERLGPGGQMGAE